MLDFHKELARESLKLGFAETNDDRVCAYFHTGGTTGLPKIAQHRTSGILYNGWCGKALMFTEADVLMCPLPMFHVLAAYPVFMSCLMSGAQMVMTTPQGYRGEGVMDNFWKLVARHRASFLITVPTAASALMQRPVDADVSTLRLAISRSARTSPRRSLQPCLPTLSRSARRSDAPVGRLRQVSHRGQTTQTRPDPGAG